MTGQASALVVNSAIYRGKLCGIKLRIGQESADPWIMQKNIPILLFSYHSKACKPFPDIQLIENDVCPAGGKALQHSNRPALRFICMKEFFCVDYGAVKYILHKAAASLRNFCMHHLQQRRINIQSSHILHFGMPDIRPSRDEGPL